MVTCGGQATIPMVHAVSRVTPVAYAEIVATVASRSAGPGTRANIDEFTRTTAAAVEAIGGAEPRQGDHHPEPGRTAADHARHDLLLLEADADEDAVAASIDQIVAEVQTYVPGYRLLRPPQFDREFTPDGRGRVAIFIEVEGAGDFLPPYAGNLDIMTAAAAKVGDEIARSATREVR